MIIPLIKQLLQCSALIFALILFFALLPLLLVLRKYLQFNIAKKRNQRLHKGINILAPIKIGGIQQWISIRGEKKENPILLILHGGPGATMMPLSFIFEPLEAHFTIVHWDQRGSGKTYTSNKQTPFSSLTIEQIHTDTLEVVNYLRQQFQQNKIFVLGASWGSILGLKLAQDHPDLLYAYFGLGQAINMKENEQISYQNTLMMAHEKKHQKAIKALEKLQSIQDKDLNIQNYLIHKKWQNHLSHKVFIKKSAWISIMSNALSAPEYSLLDYLNYFRGALKLMKSETLMGDLFNVNLTGKTNLSTAIVIFAGRKDALCPQAPVYDYFNKINAPYKKHLWFEDSGHNVPFEEAEKFMKCMVALKAEILGLTSENHQSLSQTKETILDLLAMPDVADIEFEAPTWCGIDKPLE